MAISFDIDAKLTRELKAVDLEAAKQAVVLDGLDAEMRATIGRQARISTIGATTRIENAVLTDAQVEWIDTALAQDGRPTAFAAKRAHIEDKLSKDHERSIEEVAGCREMLALIYAQASDLFPLTQATLRGLHNELLKYYPPAAYHLGRYKLVPNSVIERDAQTGAARVVLQTSDPGPITEAAMASLLAWYNETLPTDPWPIAVASELVFRFLAAHPFQDGKGRLGRALFILALLQSPDAHLRHVAPFLAIDRYIEQHKTDYYAVLARVSGGRFEPEPRNYQLDVFLRFMLKAATSALDGISVYKARTESIRALSEPSYRALQCFKEQPERRLTTKLICEETHLPQRTVSRALGTLHALGLLQRHGRGAATRYQLVF